MWDNYAQVFKKIWAATAFKGATGTTMMATNASYHLGNHVGWLQAVAEHRQKFDAFHGYCLTGWQRYVSCFHLSIPESSLNNY